MADPKDDKPEQFSWYEKLNTIFSTAISMLSIFSGLFLILVVFPLLALKTLLFYEDNIIDGVRWEQAFFRILLALTLGSLGWGLKLIIDPLIAVGEQGKANRSALIIIGLFLLILAVIVFGTILVLK